MSYSQIQLTSYTLDMTKGFSAPSNTKMLSSTASSLCSNPATRSATVKDFSSFSVVSFSSVLLRE